MAVAAAIAKAAAARVGGQLAGSAMQGAKKRVLGDPETKALAAGLERAYDRKLTAHRNVLAEFDGSPSSSRPRPRDVAEDAVVRARDPAQQGRHRQPDGEQNHHNQAPLR